MSFFSGDNSSNPGFSNIASFLGSAISGMGAINQMNEGGSIAVQGANMAAGAFRQAGQAAMAEANYNQALTKLNADRQESAIAKSIYMTGSHNQAILGGSGILGSSKSYLASVSANMTNSETQIMQLHNTTLATEQQQLYEGQLIQTEDENKARQVEYEGAVAKYQSDLASSKAMGSMITKSFSMFGSMK